MTAANRDSPLCSITTLTGSQVDRALRAGLASPGRSAAAIFQSMSDGKSGNAAYLRVATLALPAMMDARSRKYRADDDDGRLWWHPAFLEAIGSYPIQAGQPPSVDAFLAYAEQVVAEATRPTATILHFPIMRRLEQLHEAADDYTTFPEGPSAA